MVVANQLSTVAPQSGASAAARVRAAVPWRLVIYLATTAVAVIANYLLGKEMMSDTLDYHLYAGFSALHDRFSRDYFPAGPQSYFNPYIYVPFYLLVRSGAPALVASSVLAAVQSAILWLTYEIAIELAPQDTPGVRNAVGACALILAFANPILIGQLGSSYADITTAELVLGGWLLLLRAIRYPSAVAVIGAGLILGIAGGFKLTNAGHALCAFVLLAFVPRGWQVRMRYFTAFAVALPVGFLVIAAPWSLRLEQHFGNPFFPLLNGLFRSPQYPTGGTLDYRFIPDSVWAGLWRPFALTSPTRMVDDEFPSPDLRYALLSVLAVAMGTRWIYLRSRRTRSPGRSEAQAASIRALAALGCAFVADWTLSLAVAGNGRYFIAMACVAAVLVIVLLFRLLAARPRVRNYVLAAVFCLQAAQLWMGASFRSHVRWDGGSWFEVSVPKELTSGSNLYFTFGGAPDAFIAAFLPRSSALVNIGGSYELGPGGANGARVQALIHQYSPRIQVLMRAPAVGVTGGAGLPSFRYANDELESFGLRADPGECTRIVVRDVVPGVTVAAVRSAVAESLAAPDTGYMVSCRVLPDQGDRSALLAAERTANVVFDRIENACPALFQPPHLVTRNYSGKQAEIWVRQYTGTGLDVFVGPRGVEVANSVRGGPPQYIGRESDWLNTSPRLQCGRVNERYYARLLPPRS